MIATIDGSAIERFVNDAIIFNEFVDERFTLLRVGEDGALSRTNLKSGCLESMAPDNDPQAEGENVDEETGRENGLNFEKHDTDREEFRKLMTEFLLAVARGIGGTPINVLVEKDSLLLRAYEHELDWIKERENEEKKKVVVEDRNGESLRDGFGDGVVVEVKKRRSRKFLTTFCACGGGNNY